MLWVADTQLIFAAIALLLVVSVAGGGRWLRHGLALAGVVLTVDALVHQRGLYVALAGGLLALVNLLALMRSGSWSRTLDDEADAFHRRHLSRLSKAEARLLIDQGTFIEARAGEELTREGEPVDSLHFLVRGVEGIEREEEAWRRPGGVRHCLCQRAWQRPVRSRRAAPARCGRPTNCAR